MAMVATGPMPGSTPIKVPSSEPINAYKRLTGNRATLKPSQRWLRSSMASDEHGPDWQLQLQSENKDRHRKNRQANGANHGFLGSKFRARGARHHNQHDRGQCQAKVLHDGSEQHHTSKHDHGGSPLPGGNRGSFVPERNQNQHTADYGKENAEHAREITRTHSRRASERIVSTQHKRSDAEGHQQQAAIQVLPATNQIKRPPSA